MCHRGKEDTIHKSILVKQSTSQVSFYGNGPKLEDAIGLPLKGLSRRLELEGYSKRLVAQGDSSIKTKVKCYFSVFRFAIGSTGTSARKIGMRGKLWVNTH